MKKTPRPLFTFVILLIAGSLQGSAQTLGRIHKNVPDFMDKEKEIMGSRYLFDTSWVKAHVVASDGSIQNSDTVLYNYDKISQDLFFTTDRKTVYEADKDEFKSVTFYRHDSSFLFERAPVINDHDLFQVLAFSPDHYAFYKLIHTNLKKANYTTNGISESGNKYDEYIDVPEYYIVFPNKEFRVLSSLKKNAVEKVFSLSPDKDKVESFFSSHKNSGSPENYIVNLVKFLNGDALP